MLNLNLLRFHIDASTNWQRQKLFTKHVFPLVLDVGEYVSGTSDGGGDSKRGGGGGKSNSVYIDACVEMALDLAIDVMVKEGSADSSGNNGSNNSSAAGGKGMVESLEELPEAERKRISDMMHQAKTPPSVASDDDGNNGDYTYELQAVVMHKGSAFSGHYFGYVFCSIVLLSSS
jgi:hypothetical protein